MYKLYLVVTHYLSPPAPSPLPPSLPPSLSPPCSGMWGVLCVGIFSRNCYIRELYGDLCFCLDVELPDFVSCTYLMSLLTIHTIVNLLYTPNDNIDDFMPFSVIKFLVGGIHTRTSNLDRATPTRKLSFNNGNL